MAANRVGCADRFAAHPIHRTFAHLYTSVQMYTCTPEHSQVESRVFTLLAFLMAVSSIFYMLLECIPLHMLAYRENALKG